MTATPLDPGTLRWRTCRLDDLSARELQAIHRARQEVFVVEQACPYLDADGCDEHAWHIAAWAPGHAVCAHWAGAIR